MCIAIYKPAGSVIPFAHLEEGFRCNSDGAGLVWVENEVIQTFKTLSFEQWTNCYEQVLERCGDIAMLIHFRITSRGQTSLENCHPFMVGEDAACIHNGTITEIKASDLINGESDTSYFAREILSKLPEGWMHNLVIKSLLEKYLTYNKVLVMDKYENVLLLNEKGGYWDGGVWYSNKSYIRYTAPAKSDNYYKGNTCSNDYNWGDFDRCDKCKTSVKFKDLARVDKMWLCDKCAKEEQNKIMESMFSSKLIEHKNSVNLQPVVWRPCACCNTLTMKQEMTKVEIEFRYDLDEHPDQGEILMMDLMVVNPLIPSMATGWFCADCAEWALDIGYTNIVSVEVLETPIDVNDYEEDDNDQTTLSVGE